MARTLPGRRVAAGLALAALLPAGAHAQGSPPPPLPGDAAIYQYREALPTGAGPVAPTPGSSRSTPLAAAVQSRLAAEGGDAAPLLEKVATSSDFGAPQGAPREPDATRRPAAAAELPPASATRAAAAAADAVGGAPGRLVALLALLLAASFALAVAARRGARTPV